MAKAVGPGGLDPALIRRDVNRIGVAMVVFLVALAVWAFVSDDSGDSHARKVGRSDVQPWPFVADSGTLRCRSGSVTFEANGTEYGLNGTATAAGYPSVLPMWALDPAAEGLRISMHGAIVAGQALC